MSLNLFDRVLRIERRLRTAEDGLRNAEIQATGAAQVSQAFEVYRDTAKIFDQGDDRSPHLRTIPLGWRGQAVYHSLTITDADGITRINAGGVIGLRDWVDSSAGTSLIPTSLVPTISQPLILNLLAYDGNITPVRLRYAPVYDPMLVFRDDLYVYNLAPTRTGDTVGIDTLGWMPPTVAFSGVVKVSYRDDTVLSGTTVTTFTLSGVTLTYDATLGLWLGEYRMVNYAKIDSSCSSATTADGTLYVVLFPNRSIAVSLLTCTTPLPFNPGRVLAWQARADPGGNYGSGSAYGTVNAGVTSGAIIDNGWGYPASTLTRIFGGGTGNTVTVLDLQAGSTITL